MPMWWICSHINLKYNLVQAFSHSHNLLYNQPRPTTFIMLDVKQVDKQQPKFYAVACDYIVKLVIMLKGSWNGCWASWQEYMILDLDP